MHILSIVFIIIFIHLKHKFKYLPSLKLYVYLIEQVLDIGIGRIIDCIYPKINWDMKLAQAFIKFDSFIIRKNQKDAAT